MKPKTLTVAVMYALAYQRHGAAAYRLNVETRAGFGLRLTLA